MTNINRVRQLTGRDRSLQEYAAQRMAILEHEKFSPAHLMDRGVNLELMPAAEALAVRAV